VASKYGSALIGGVALTLAIIGVTLQLYRPSVNTNFFTLVAIALSGDMLWLASVRRNRHRWVGWVLLVLANAPLVISTVREALPT